MKLFETEAERHQALVVAAGVALHAILSSHVPWEHKYESQQDRIRDTIGAAFEMAREFLKQAEAV
jgi:hypothetical protein